MASNPPACMATELNMFPERFAMIPNFKCIVSVGFIAMAAVVVSPVGMLPAFGAKIQAMQLSADQVAAIQRINAYLNSYQSLRGDFVQTSPKGRSTRGVMNILKPGKLRFEYEAPNPLLIASDGKWLTIKDKVKERGDQVPLSSTPLRLIVAPKVNLMAEASVVSFEQTEGFTTVGLSDKKGALKGQIILVFDETKGELQQWIIVDGKGQRTTVQLGNLEKNVKLDPKMFNVTIKREPTK